MIEQRTARLLKYVVTLRTKASPVTTFWFYEGRFGNGEESFFFTNCILIEPNDQRSDSKTNHLKSHFRSTIALTSVLPVDLKNQKINHVCNMRIFLNIVSSWAIVCIYQKLPVLELATLFFRLWSKKLISHSHLCQCKHWGGRIFHEGIMTKQKNVMRISLEFQQRICNNFSIFLEAIESWH